MLAIAMACCSALSQDGYVAASQAYYHTWDGYRQFDNDCASFVSRSEYAGGWSFISSSFPRDRTLDTVWYSRTLLGKSIISYTWSAAANFERHLNATKRASLVREISPTLRADYSDVFIQPGDIITADWGDGNDQGPVSKNQADGKTDHVMIVQQSLGNGDFVYCQHSAPKMRRLFDLLSNPSLRYAKYRIYHVAGNDSLRGLSENMMYRDENRPEVYVAVNGGLFWVPDVSTVDFYGGWGNVTVLPSDTLFNRGHQPVAGTMMKEIGSPDVWVAEGYTRRWVRTALAVNRLGGWPAVRAVPKGSIGSMFWIRGTDIYL